MLVNGVRILEPAYERGFAVPAFNISDYAMLRGCLEACEEVRSPMIVSIHPSEWELVGDEFLASVLELARSATIPVAVQLDHGATFEQVMGAIRLGFTSVMIDGSLLPYDENVAICRKVAEAAHAVGVSVEGEIGTIGARDIKSAEEMADIVYTTPSEARDFVRDTGVDYLAVAVGTCHGVYPAGVEPKLKLDLLREIKDSTPVPLVLHGGSGTPDAEVSEAVTLGIAKVNISADIKVSYFNRLREVLLNPAQREPHDIYPLALETMMATVRHKVEVLGAVGSADFYPESAAAREASPLRDLQAAVQA
ncbi:ketose-bisphosphate aldolase [Amnibacterium flavum]|uniref:Ketose-bisphosphate aldolase n=1 Tax=Amnibacterium flavum TaxID=2173173 RepID=A0A2V1HQ39_9MICO|nr:ketose-bisphosphate aldolase [Amnibacterium flavum]PVZ94726.1 ketose-bisphosphate aldolase [Amnibacterium flavum]